MKRCLAVVLCVLSVSICNAGDMQDYTYWFPRIAHPPKVKLKLPPDFRVFSATPAEYARPDERYDMTFGVLWTDPETGKIYDNAKKPKLDGLPAPLFWVKLSSDVGQVPNSDKFSCEAELAKASQALALQNA